jgi:chitodextrinase
MKNILLLLCVIITPNLSWGASDKTPPTALTTVSAVVLSETTIDVSWGNSTDNVGVTQVQIYRNGNLLGFFTYANHIFHDTAAFGLTNLTNYTYVIYPMDAAMNVGPGSTTAQVRTHSLNPPTVPTGLTVTPVGGTRLDLAWNASTSANGAPITYRVKMDGVQQTTTTNTTYIKVGLTTYTTYSFTVSAYDSFAQESLPCTAVNGTTNDTQRPTQVQTLHDTATGTTTVDLAWSASTDNAAVIGYKLYRGATLIADQAGLTFQDTGLLPSTNYSYTAYAYDQAGNQSFQGNTLSVTTDFDGENPGNPIEWGAIEDELDTLQGNVEALGSALTTNEQKIIDINSNSKIKAVAVSALVGFAITSCYGYATRSRRFA